MDHRPPPPPSPSPGKEGLDFYVEQKGSELLPVSSSPRGPLGDGAQLGGDRCGLRLMKHVWAQRGGGLAGKPGWASLDWRPGLHAPGSLFPLDF